MELKVKKHIIDTKYHNRILKDVTGLENYLNLLSKEQNIKVRKILLHTANSRIEALKKYINLHEEYDEFHPPRTSDYLKVKDDYPVFYEYYYNHYLKQEHWQKVKGDALKRANHMCQLCGMKYKRSNKNPLQVHHNNYKCLWEERDCDVMVICKRCHNKHHNRHIEE